MKIAFYSDIHGNFEALEAVLADMKAQEVEQRVCLGDLVGYGADPIKCVDLVRQTTSHVLKGNHDEESSKETPIDHYRPHVQAGIFLARQQLSPEQKKYLAELPMKMNWDDFYLVHSSLFEPEKWRYLNNALNVEINFQHQKTPICLVGHTHIPRFFERIDQFTKNLPLAGELKIHPGRKYLVNVGSVGQSRDGNWHSCYAIYNTLEKSFSFRRIPYEIEKTKKRILDSGLPEYLADRLSQGK